MKLLKKAEELILKAEYAAIIILLLLMCFLAFAQVILRNVFSFSLVWADPMVRMAVLWVAILGASVATSTGERGHIHIDLFSRVIPKPYNEYLDAFLSLVASVACFFFFFVAVKFVLVERTQGSVVQHLHHTPEWIFTLIFPIGFLLMSFKFLLCFLVDIADMVKGDRGKKGVVE